MVGTDHHPFDRLVDWVDEAARRRPDTRFVVQHGDSKAPRVAEGTLPAPPTDWRAPGGGAAAPSVTAGPGPSWMPAMPGTCRSVCPRDPALGEHVDGHQQRFAALVHRAGVVTRAETVVDFHAALDEVLAKSVEGRASARPTSSATEAARESLAHELDQLMIPRPRGPRWGRVAAGVRQPSLMPPGGAPPRRWGAVPNLGDVATDPASRAITSASITTGSTWSRVMSAGGWGTAVSNHLERRCSPSSPSSPSPSLGLRGACAGDRGRVRARGSRRDGTDSERRAAGTQPRRRHQHRRKPIHPFGPDSDHRASRRPPGPFPDLELAGDRGKSGSRVDPAADPHRERDQRPRLDEGSRRR